MTVSENGKLTELHFDRRVRDRLLASGVLDAATIEAHLASLPDLEEQAEVLTIEQPALGGVPVGSRPEPELNGEGAE